jgi:hypothetical protein
LDGLDIAAAVSEFEPNLLVEFESVADRQLVAVVEIHDMDLKNSIGLLAFNRSWGKAILRSWGWDTDNPIVSDK